MFSCDLVVWVCLTPKCCSSKFSLNVFFKERTANLSRSRIHKAPHMAACFRRHFLLKQRGSIFLFHCFSIHKKLCFYFPWSHLLIYLGKLQVSVFNYIYFNYSICMDPNILHVKLIWNDEIFLVLTNNWAWLQPPSYGIKKDYYLTNIIFRTKCLYIQFFWMLSKILI